jgi:hypothetical protein
MTDTTADPTDVPTCVFCSHPIEQHGTTETGCSVCSCGHDPDWADD